MKKTWNTRLIVKAMKKHESNLGLDHHSSQKRQHARLLPLFYNCHTFAMLALKSYNPEGKGEG